MSPYCSTTLPGTVPSLYQRVIGLEFCLSSLSVPLVGAAIIAGLAVLHKSRYSGKEEIVRLLVLWFCGAMFGILMQGWCWAHQFKQVYPPLALLLPESSVYIMKAKRLSGKSAGDGLYPGDICADANIGFTVCWDSSPPAGAHY